MRSASSRDGAMRRNAKIEYESTLASHCVATSVEQNQCEFSGRHALRCYKRRRDSEGDATQRIAQRDFADFRGAGTSVARVRWTARYARAKRGARALCSVESL